jgi:hypothetical protein
MSTATTESEYVLTPLVVVVDRYMTTLGVGCGSLLGATAILPFAAVIFHDSKTMTSLFVHIVPPCLLHT